MQNASPMNFIEQGLLQELEVAAKTILLPAGQAARHLYFVRKGCVRSWISHRGKDLTTQFFLENEPVSSIESLLTGQPSLFTLETVEPCSLWVLPKPEFDRLLAESPPFKEWFHQGIIKRLVEYSHHLLSYIRDTPPERYQDLVKNRPYLLQRVPQHYIASYLGISRVSLSRIRGRK